MHKGYPMCPQSDLGVNLCLFQGELIWLLGFAISRRRIVSHAMMMALNHAPPAANPPIMSLK